MKIGRIIIIWLGLIVLALLFIGCNGGIPTVPEDESIYSSNLIQVKDLNTNILFMAGNENNNDAIAILGKKDNEGNPTEITGFCYSSSENEVLYFKAGLDGLPKYVLDDQGNRIVFSDYTTSSVEVELYDSNENLIGNSFTININSQDLLKIKQLYNSIHSKQKYPVDWFINFLDVDGWVEENLGIIVYPIVPECDKVYDENGNLTEWYVPKPWESDYSPLDTLTEYDKIIVWFNVVDYTIPTFLSPIIDTIVLVDEVIGSNGDEEEIENISNTIEEFANAMNNEKWQTAKSYCVPNSVAYSLVEEHQSNVETLYDICDQFTYQCSGSANDPIVNISGTSAIANITGSSGSCVMTCTIGGDDSTIDLSGSGTEKYYLEKINNVWLINNFESIYVMEYEEI